VGFTALIPLLFLVESLFRSDYSLVLNYAVPLGYLLGLLGLVLLFQMNRVLFGVMVATLYGGFLFSLFLPGSHGTFVLIFFAAIPLFYVLGGVLPGRVASGGFIIFILVVAALRLLGFIPQWNIVARQDSIIAAVVCLVIQFIIAESNEGSHQARMKSLVDHYFFETETGLPNRRSLEKLTLEPGWHLVLVRITNLAFLKSWQGIHPGTLLKNLPRSIPCTVFSGPDLGPYCISEEELVFLEPPGLTETGTLEWWQNRLRSVVLPDGSPSSLVSDVWCYTVHSNPESADRALLEAQLRLALGTRGATNDQGSSDSPPQAAIKASSLVKELLDCFQNRRLSAVFQPVYDVERGGISFLEALTRMEVGGRLVSPEPFMSLISALKLDSQMTDFIVTQGVQMALATGYSVSVNLTYRDLEDQPLVARIAHQCRFFEQRQNKLILELTEHAAFQNTDLLRRFVSKIHEAGGYVFLDDFGTGYSNYASIVDARFDAIKIAGSIVRQAPASPELRILLSGVATFCQASGIGLVAEHISDEVILQMVQDDRVRFLQGFLLQKPVSGSRILESDFEFGLEAESELAARINSRSTPFTLVRQLQ